MKQSTKETLDNYVLHNFEPGGFCTAVLENNLMEAFGRADIQNRHDLFEICGYVYNELPSACHGSREKVVAWLKRSPEEVERIGELWKKLKEAKNG